MRRLSYALLTVFIFSLPWEDTVSVGGARSLTSLIGFVLVFTTALAVWRERRVTIPPPLFFALFAFALWQLLSFWWSVDYSVSIGHARTLLQLVALVWIVGELADTPRRYFGLMQAYVFGAFVVCFFLIQAYLSGQPLESYRYAPEDLSLNESAIILAIGIVLALILIHQRRQALLFYINAAFIPLAMFSVILTASRGGFIATLIALTGTVFVIRGRRSAHRYAGAAFILGVFAVLFFSVSSNTQLADNVSRVTFRADTESLQTLTGRTTIWSAGLDSFQENPLVGKGGGTFRLVVRDALGAPRAPHNLFISVAVEAGIIGLVIVLSALFGALLPTLKTSGVLRILLVIMFFVVLEMAFIANVETSKVVWFVWTLLSIAPIAGAGAVARENVGPALSRGVAGTVRRSLHE